jgi:thiol-disulfide isomerase/thioredoxin
VPSLLVAPLAALAILAFAGGVLFLQRVRQQRLVGRAVGGAPLAPGADPPDILYFTGDNCTVCHVAQRPALERLRVLIDDVSIREINVAREPALARRYRVMTLPTIVVLDAHARTIAVNAGFTPETALRGQVEAARATSLAGAIA